MLRRSGSRRAACSSSPAAGRDPAARHRFGDGSDVLAVSRPGAGAAGEAAAAAAWGRQLLANPAVIAEDPAVAVLLGGQADPRALMVLAALAARGPVHVLDLSGAAAEDPALPRHQVVLTGLDARGLA